MNRPNRFETENDVRRREAREAFRKATNKPAVVPGNKVMNNINKVNATLKEKMRLAPKGGISEYRGYNLNYANKNRSRVKTNGTVLPSRVTPFVTRPALPDNVQNRILKKKEALEYVNNLIAKNDERYRNEYNTLGKRHVKGAFRASTPEVVRSMKAGMQRHKKFKNKLAAFLTNDSVKMSQKQKTQVVQKLVRNLYRTYLMGVYPRTNYFYNLVTYHSEGNMNKSRFGSNVRRKLIMDSLNLLKKPEDFDEMHKFYELAGVYGLNNRERTEFYPKPSEGRTFMSMPPNKRRHILNVMKKIKNSNGAAREDAMIEYQKHFLNRGKMVTLLKQRKRAGLNWEIRNYKKEHGKKRKLPERFANERSKIARIGNLPSSTLKNMMNSLKHNP